MDKTKLKALLPAEALRIAEAAAIGTVALVGTAATGQTANAAVTAATPNPVTSSVGPAIPTNTEGAIMLNLIQTDPVTGLQVAQHYSHASHSSHSSHYSGR